LHDGTLEYNCFWYVGVNEEIGIAGVLVKYMMHGLLMKIEFVKPLGCWRSQLFDYPMLEK